MFLDICYIQETDYAPKEIFLRTIDVEEDSNIQDIRTALQKELNNKVVLEIVRSRYVAQSYHQHFPRPPSLLLCSDKEYSMRDILNIIPVDGEIVDPEFKLEIISRVKVIAYQWDTCGDIY